jgi:zinc transporter ZupT
MAEEVQHHNEPSTHDHGSHDHFAPGQNEDEQGDAVNAGNAQGDAENEGSGDEREQAKLMRMSINTALAIGIHNFPEVCFYWRPRVGLLLCCFAQLKKRRFG